VTLPFDLKFKINYPHQKGKIGKVKKYC